MMAVKSEAKERYVAEIMQTIIDRLNVLAADYARRADHEEDEELSAFLQQRGASVLVVVRHLEEM